MNRNYDYESVFTSLKFIRYQLNLKSYNISHFCNNIIYLLFLTSSRFYISFTTTAYVQTITILTLLLLLTFAGFVRDSSSPGSFITFV